MFAASCKAMLKQIHQRKSQCTSAEEIVTKLMSGGVGGRRGAFVPSIPPHPLPPLKRQIPVGICPKGSWGCQICMGGWVGRYTYSRFYSHITPTFTTIWDENKFIKSVDLHKIIINNTWLIPLFEV